MMLAFHVLFCLTLVPAPDDIIEKMSSKSQRLRPVRRECVCMVHGLGRTKHSMQWLGTQFEKQGYQVVHLSYRSTRQSIASSAQALSAQLARKLNGNEERVHFVTHSMGGIVVRAVLQKHRPAHLGRIVMLGPPNQGSELVNRFGRNPIYRLVTGPAGQELGTDAASTPNQLGRVDYEVGVIAGSHSGNPLFSALIDGECDGKVSVKRACVEGMRDLMVLRCSHTFMMRNREVAAQALHFIAQGEFSRSAK
jgi:pimeloyl-ACP methyl ester carboxylesterase